MRSAGYHVRVVAQEDLGWEENPPTLLEFMRRDLRWCQGNMQYFRLLSLANLKPVSRYQLMLAIVMFIGSPAWIGLLLLATVMLASFDSPARFIRSDVGNMLFAWVLVMWFAPKIASFIDLLLRPEARRGFGGADVSSSILSSKPYIRPCCVRSSGSATPSFSPACFSIARSAGSGKYATTTLYPSGWHSPACGRRPSSDGSPSAWYRQRSRRRCHMFFFSQAGRPLRCRSRW